MENQVGSVAQVHDAPWYKDIDSQQWHVLFAGFLGWCLDSFDNLLYSFTIYTLIKQWNITTAETGFVATATLFASAIGGAIFGVLSDKIGRLKVLNITILIYAMATGFVGLSQSIGQILIARVFVGLGLGGEWSAAATLISETWPEKHRGKGLAIMQSGLAVGGMVACLIAGPIIASWGWRSLYFIGVLPGLLVLYIRRHVKESPVWLASRNKPASAEKKENNSFLNLFKKGLVGKTMLGLLFVGAIMTAAWPVSTFVSAFLATPVAKGGAGQTTALSTMLVFPTYFGALLGYLTFGFVSDRIGRKKTFIFFIFLALIFQPLSIYGARFSVGLYVITSLLSGFFGTGLYSGLGAILSEQFPTKLRGSGLGICYNGGRGIGSLAVMLTGIVIPAYGYVAVLVGASLIWAFAFIMAFLFKDRTGIKFEA